MELLSPAGNREALTAAIACGADAVYLGYTAFGARSYAGNFDAEGLREAVEYAHERAKKVYVTVNTLVKTRETDDLCDVLELLCRCGADAVLVQDLGVARIARERFPGLKLHASTQMTITNAQGARLMKRLGFERIVPARECDLAQLRSMADTGVEVEAFAHGALCVAVSGQCLFSSMIGGRSGNRGRCAQPCRLPYRLDDGTSGYLLSTKDLMLIDRLPQLRDAGVYSFKLEGRMKRPEYVGIVTRAYREALDAAEARVPYHASAQTVEALAQIFNRGGFTEGYAMGMSNAALMSWQRPNHWGVYMGQVSRARGLLVKTSLERPLHDGDGLQIRGRQEIDLTYSGPEMPSGAEATLRVTGSTRPGDAVYRLTDAMQMQEIRAVMDKEWVKIPLIAELTAMPGSPAELTLEDPDGHRVRVCSAAPVEAAEQRALGDELAMKQLGKTGGTPYSIDRLTLHSRQAFMTAGMLNELRREGLAAMRAERIRVRPAERRAEQHSALSALAGMKREKPLLIVQGERLEDAWMLTQCGADLFEWQPQDYQTLEGALARAGGVRPALVLPAMMTTDELEAIYGFVCRHADALCGVVLNNVGQFEPKWPVPIFGGQGLNVMNAQSAAFFAELGARRLTVSCELNEKEIRALTSQGGCFELEAYGRAQLMLLSHCPRRTTRGDEAQDARCDACAGDGGCPAVYTDRKGYRFPARRTKLAHGCVVRLYNSVHTDMARMADRLRETGCSLRLSFTDEPPERQREITASYRVILDGKSANHAMAKQSTTGQFARGVE
ncbi:MAG: DUF3656 domain-containing protein [Clostridia bacterium]|nr:DUF3656 domain-containing protein [Clostridia bacterium]